MSTSQLIAILLSMAFERSASRSVLETRFGGAYPRVVPRVLLFHVNLHSDRNLR